MKVYVKWVREDQRFNRFLVFPDGSTLPYYEALQLVRKEDRWEIAARTDYINQALA